MKTVTIAASIVAAALLMPTIGLAQTVNPEQEAGEGASGDSWHAPSDATVAGFDIAEVEALFVDTTFLTGDIANDWVIGGDAQLTAGGLDDDGDGWLRLTGNEAFQSGYAFFDAAFPSDEGVSVEFEYASWGGSGADGLSVFLFDGAVGDPTGPAFEIGQSGGSLGYAQSCDTPGITGGYVGIGIDAFGNYSSAHCHEGGFDAIADSIAVRGPQSEDYAYIAGTDSLPFGVDCPADVCADRPDQNGAQYRRVRVDITPVAESFEVSVWVQAGADGEMQQVVTPLALPSIPPEDLKLGFGASTGASTNVHEIRNVVVRRIER